MAKCLAKLQSLESEYTKEENHRKITLRTVMQSVYLTLNFFVRNDLVSYASTCAFGFLFSFIPVVMMILVILIRVLHANIYAVSSLIGSNQAMEAFVQAVNAFLKTNPSLGGYFNVESAALSLNSITKITNFEIVIGFAIIWMARRFFVSVMNGMHKVFKQEAKYRPVISQLMSLGGEALLVVLISVIVFAVVTFHAVVKLPLLDELVLRYPSVFKNIGRIVNVIPFLAMFLAVSVCYRIGSASRPRFMAVFASAASCTACFYVFQKLMHIFINVNKYNIIYGVLSGIIVMLMEVFFFFIIFLFFAQFLFVYQFFTTLILGELYLLPARDDVSILAMVRRTLFIRPDTLLNDGEYVVSLNRGEYLYKRGERCRAAYYLAQGTVVVMRPNGISYVECGNFLGEEAFFLDGVRHEDVKASSYAKLIAIPEDIFLKLLERNPRVSKKALSEINGYFAKFSNLYGEYSG